MAAHEPWAELGAAITAIRAQLQESMDAGEDERLKFRTGPVELEFTVEIRKEGEGTARVFVLPALFETKGSLGKDRTHRIKLTLHPVDARGRDARISDPVTERPR